MRKRSFWIGAVMMVLLAVTVVAIGGSGGSVGAAEDLQIGNPPPGDGGCICPQNYDPVVCTAPDGSRRAFSNACFAGCAGFTRCLRVVQP